MSFFNQDTAVTQTDNQKKAEIKVKWNVSETGDYFFRLFLYLFVNMMQ